MVPCMVSDVPGEGRVGLQGREVRGAAELGRRERGLATGRKVISCRSLYFVRITMV
jgi:hypothetical protein